MPSIKLKVLNAAGQTLAASEAAEQVSLVYAGAYQPSDWIALETDTPGLHCVIQLEDSMPPALVYIPGLVMNYQIPSKDNRCNHSPKSFTGRCHLVRARMAAAEEIAARRNLALNPYDAHPIVVQHIIFLQEDGVGGILFVHVQQKILLPGDRKPRKMGFIIAREYHIQNLGAIL